MKIKKCLFAVCLIVFLAAFFSFPAWSEEKAKSAADFYRGKTLTIVVTSRAGGGTDLNARIFSSYLGSAMGCSVVIQNQTAGRGNVARTALMKTTKPDGLTIMTDPLLGMWIPWAFNEPGTEGFDITKFRYLGSINYGQAAIIMGTSSPYNTVSAMQNARRPVRFAGGKMGSFPIALFIALEALNVESKVVLGYPGQAACMLALEQGEADGFCTGIEEVVRLDKAGQGKALMVVGPERNPDYPDVPALGEFATIEESRLAILKAFEKEGGIFVAPPNTPADRVKYLSDSIAKVFADKGFQASFAKAGRTWLGAKSASDLQEEATNFANAKGAFVSMVDTLVKKYVQK